MCKRSCTHALKQLASPVRQLRQQSRVLPDPRLQGENGPESPFGLFVGFFRAQGEGLVRVKRTLNRYLGPIQTTFETLQRFDNLRGFAWVSCLELQRELLDCFQKECVR